MSRDPGVVARRGAVGRQHGERLGQPAVRDRSPPAAAAGAAPRRSRRSRSSCPRRTTAPKPSRKSIGTPMTRATSASFSAVERAREKNSSWSAAMHPRARPLRNTGMPQRLDQLAQRVLAVAPVQVRPGHDHRALGLAQQRGRALDALGRRALPRDRQHARAAAGSVPSMNTWSSGKSTKVGPSGGGHRRGQRDVDEAGITSVLGAVRAELGQRVHERDVVDLLQRALAPAHRRRAPAEHEHRRVVLQRRGHRAHAVGHAGPRGQRARRRARG